MTKKKDPTEWVRRGRPPKTPPLLASDPGLIARKSDAIRRAVAEDAGTHVARKRDARALLEQLDRLRYTEKDVILAYWADIMCHGLPVTKVVSLGPLGYELVETTDMHAGLKASELIWAALHERKGPSTLVQVNNETPAPRVAFLVMDNDRLQDEPDIRPASGPATDPERLPG